MEDEIILKKENKFNWKVFGIIMTAVAVLALAFGIVMLVTKNNEAAKGGTSTGSNVTAGNPVVEAESPALYMINGVSPIFNIGEKEVVISLTVENGAIAECAINMLESDEIEDCQISGVEGKIYKVVEFDNTKENIKGLALIMTDGTVEYVPLAGVNGPEFSVKGKFKIDGEVVDIMVAGVFTDKYDAGGKNYWTNLFVLKNGKILEFNSAMLEGM